jgi:hypothetical protein
MASNSHSQRRAKKAKLEPISIAELAGDSTMTGFSDLFKIPTVASPPLHYEEDNQAKPPAVIAPPVITGPPPAVTVQPSPKVSPAVQSTSHPITSGAHPTAAPAITAPPAVLRSRPIHRCLIAQHGHSSNDQLVYQLLWGQGTPEVNGRPGNRIISIGVAKIARLAGTIHERNIPIILRRLIAKQSIEIVRKEISDQSEARLYRVFSYDEILERRRRLGMEWVVRSSRGVDFVDPTTGSPLGHKTAPPAVIASPATAPAPGTTSPVANMPAADSTTPDDDIGPVPPDVSSRPPPAVSSVPLGNGREKNRESTSAIRSILQAKLPVFDDSAVEQVWADCRRQVPDVSPEEVGVLFERKLPESRARAVENPVGFLVRAVARSCTPAAVGALRQGREEIQQPGGISREYWEQLLENPDATEAMRIFAREQLRLTDAPSELVEAERRRE